MILAAYIALPILLAPCLLVKKKALSCLMCGALMFAFLVLACGEIPANSELYGIYGLLPVYPASLITRFSAPIGFLFPAKLLSMLFPEPFALNAALAAVFTFGVMSYIYRYCEVPSFSSLLAAAGGFLIFAAAQPCVFIAAVICAFSFRYVSQRRFLRFAALALLASCFCFDAVLLLPLYFIFLIPAGLPLLFGGAAVCGLALFTGVYTGLFDIMYAKTYDTLQSGLSPLIPAALAVLCVWAGAMKKMLVCGKKLREYADTMTTALFAAAFLSLICVYDIRYLPLTLMLAFPSVLTLGGVLLSTTESLITLTFRDKKRPVLIGFAVTGLLLLGVWYWQMLAQGHAAFGLWQEAAI